MTINVLRYPGGKSKVLEKIVPTILDMLQSGGAYCEPFTGGGSVSLSVAQQTSGLLIRLNDADPSVAAVWRTLATGRVEGLITELAAMNPSVALFRELQASRPRGMVEAAARFIALNRMAFSGKAHTTPIGGWRQTGKWKVGVEWRFPHVSQNLRSAAEVLDKHTVEVTCLDFSLVIRRSDVTYADPPYYHCGQNMYPVALSPEQHVFLAKQLFGCRRWLASYDDCPEIHRLYTSCRIRRESWTYSANAGPNHKGAELLIEPRRP